MEAHARVLADNLAPGATSAELAALEKKHRIPIPADLKRLWMLHDGQLEEMNGFVGSMDLLSASQSFAMRRDILSFVEFCREHADEWCGPDLTEEEVGSDAWLPIANRDSDSLVVSAVSGRVFTCGKDAPPLALVASSVSAWLEAYASAIERGAYEVTEGFGDVYLARAEAREEQRADKAARQRARRVVMRTRAAVRALSSVAAKKALGAFGAVTAVEATGLRPGVRLRIERPIADDRAKVLDASLRANAFSCFTRTFCDDRLQIVEAQLSLDAAESPLVVEGIAAELSALQSSIRTPWRRQKLDAKTITTLARKGQCVVLLPVGKHFRIEGDRPIFAARVSDTLQMRGFASMRAPTSLGGLEAVNAMNVAASKMGRAACVFVFDGQLGAGAGTVFGDDAPWNAENAYWDMGALLEEIGAHGTAPRAAPEVVDAALAKKAVSCLDALVT